MYDNNDNLGNWSAWDEEPQNQPVKKESNRTGVSTGALVAIALVCAILGGMLGAGGLYLITNRTNEMGAPQNNTTVLQGARENAVIDTVPVQTNKLMTQSEVYAANVNSTVGITTSTTVNFWGYQTTAAASGSGFILTADGYILTNHHVIENSNSITVTMYDNTSYEAALIGYDASNDIAVLKVDATDLVPVVLGDSEKLNVGDQVVAIGNPLGELTFTLTSGYVSAKDREVTMSTGTTMKLLQTDCAINSGNSGGALFNMYGEVVGITNAKYSGNSNSGASIDNIAFAIPINDVWGIIEDIIEDGFISKPFIGVSVVNVSEETQRYGLPKGASVVSVTEDSPAQEAGLQENDIVTSVNGVEITSSGDLVAIVSACDVGDTLEMKVYRQGSTIDITVTVGEKAQEALPQEQAATQQNQQNQQGFPFPFGN